MPPAHPSISPECGAPAHLGELAGPTIIQRLHMERCNLVLPKSPLEVLGCCRMQKELLGNVVSIKINALTRSQIATANVLLNEI